MLVGIPLALGSWSGSACLFFIIPVLIWWLADEEKLLKKDLPGYTELPRRYATDCCQLFGDRSQARTEDTPQLGVPVGLVHTRPA